MKYAFLKSQFGTVILISRDEYLSELDISQDSATNLRAGLKTRYPDALESPDHFQTVYSQLSSYFRGDRIDFTTPVDLTGITSFTEKVLEEVHKIPYGCTKSYGAIAESLNCRGAARAVGQAVGRNPLPLIIPCHRVIQGSGSLGGFSMGLKLKEKLLSLEGIRFDRSVKNRSNKVNSSTNKGTE
jgi:methylated-DNA-[protein]-cysteine S-methyltransferase